MTTFYRKEGRKYIPVSEYDNELTDAWPEGTHLTISAPGRRSRRYDVDPALAPMIAAGYTAEERITQVIMDKLSFRPEQLPVTPAQHKAWDNMKKVWGEDMCRLQSGSIGEAVRAGVDEMVKEAESLLLNPALQNSYNNYILLCKLTIGK